MSGHSQSHGQTHEHAGPGLGIYFAVFGALIVFTWLTVWVSTIDMGALNTPIAMIIAITKASLVILYFMHVKYQTTLTKLTVVCGFVWLGIMFVLTLMDFFSRTWIQF